MTRSEVMRDFMKKTVVPVAVALLLFSIFSRIFVQKWIAGLFPDLACLQGAIWHRKDVYAHFDWLWYFGTVGVVALNLVLGGLIGGVILIWKLAVAIWYLPLSIVRFVKA